jgi:hypothetical protein
MGTVLDLIVALVFTRRAAGVMADTRLGSGGWFSIEGAAK